MSGMHPRTARAWRDARRILAVRLDNLGDVLMTTPALAAIKHQGGVQLTLLTSRTASSALAHLPMLDDAIVYEAPWHRKLGTGDAGDHALIERLAAQRFDAAVIFTVCTQSALPAALMCRLARIPLRLAHCRENPYDLLTDWVPECDVVAGGMRHEVARQLDLVRSVGFVVPDEHLVFRYPADSARSMASKLHEAGGDAHAPYVLVHPGASAESRRYPAEHFGMAADAVAEATGCQIVFAAAPDERPLVDAARRAMRTPSVSLLGCLSLAEFAALVAGAQVVLCNNSAPAHLAAALGTPVVVLYALTNPQHTPWKTRARVLNHDVPCRHCLKSVCPQRHHDCLRKVPPQAVADAALELIGSALRAVPVPLNAS